LAALVLLAASAVLGAQQVAAEGASPAGHLQAAAVSETSARFQWMAGRGNEWYCLDLAGTPDDLESLSGTWFNSGCGMTGTSHVVKGLQCSGAYFARVWAQTADGGMYSPPLRVDMHACASTITAPTNMRTLFTTENSIRLAWDPGDHNNWFCVELALDQSELLAHGDSWESLGCGTTNTELTIDGLECETHYYYRVVAWNFRVDTIGDVRVVTTGDCDGRLRRAPIESVDAREVGAGYEVDVVASLPNGCLSPGSYAVEREANLILVTVRNIYIEPLTTCADLQDTHEWTISLGSDFVEGQTYLVIVNDSPSVYFTYTPPEDTF